MSFVLSQDSCNTYCNVELPNIPLMKGTNNLSMDITVQLSKECLKAKLKVYNSIYEILQNVVVLF